VFQATVAAISRASSLRGVVETASGQRKPLQQGAPLIIGRVQPSCGSSGSGPWHALLGVIRLCAQNFDDMLQNN
jgi:hypothetical protein